MASHSVLCYSFKCSIRCSPRKGLREEFALRSTDENTAGEDQPSFFFSKKAFGAIGMKESMSGVVNSLNLIRPSKIQALSYNEILSGKTCILADQTGSGKTLAYLLPVIQRMIESKKNGTLGATVSKSPYILIIAPTTELARFDSLSLMQYVQ
jgi:superfamily II DNA/RNA helicase